MADLAGTQESPGLTPEPSLDDSSKDPHQAVSTKTRKGRRKNRGITQRGPGALPKNRGTGFEEYFADPPMTPCEAVEEKNEIYANVLPFEERIQSCIQRFRARRRLQGNLTLYFDEYLFLGGIDTFANAYSGQDTAELKDLTPAQRREATATDTVHGSSGADDRFYNGDNEDWYVDFTGVAAGFFSTVMGQLTAFVPEKTEAAIGLVENFLSAIGVCSLARDEWPKITQFRESLPGRFNLAAAEQFGISETHDWSFLKFTRPDTFGAKTTFSTACALLGEAQTLRAMIHDDLRVASLHTCDLRIIKLDHPSGDIANRFNCLSIDGSHSAIEALGKVYFEPTVIDDGWVHSAAIHPFSGTSIYVYMESSMLGNLKPGMQLTASIATLNTGLRFIKTIEIIVPTFYTLLPQQLMKHYKQPRESDRPAHSATEADKQAVA